jgi:phage-related protein
MPSRPPFAPLLFVCNEGEAKKRVLRVNRSTHPVTESRPSQSVRRRWRDYTTESGRRPVKEFLDALDDADLASVVAAMVEVRQDGLRAARHLEGDIYEVRADGKGVVYRVLFAPLGRRKQILLSLDGFKKKTQKTPPATIRLAKRRLRDWQRRGRRRRSSLVSHLF